MNCKKITKMPTGKLLQAAAMALLVAGASVSCTSSSSKTNDCPDGTIIGGTYDKIVIERFVECSVVDVLVTGHVRVKNAEQFTMQGSIVSGDVKVINTASATLASNLVFNGNIIAKGNAESSFLGNVVFGGDMLVNVDQPPEQEQLVEVEKNQVIDGTLQVSNNNAAIVRKNTVRDGDIICENNDELFAYYNNTTDGVENCSKIIFEDSEI